MMPALLNSYWNNGLQMGNKSCCLNIAMPFYHLMKDSQNLKKNVNAIEVLIVPLI